MGETYMDDGESITAIGSGVSGVLSDSQFLEYVASWVEGDGGIRDNAELIVGNLRGIAAKLRLEEGIISACVRHYFEAPPHTDPGMGCRLCIAVKEFKTAIGDIELKRLIGGRL